MVERYYVTTAIAYPNGRPHMGHALEIIQADVIARFHKLLGKKVFFQTGTDEHGVKNWETAKKEGKDILEFLDENVAVFKELYEKLDIDYDNFIRTSDKKIHYTGAQALWKKLVAAEDIYKKKYTGLYCVGCESFKTEKELVDGKCPNHPTREIETIEEENYFFKLSKYKDKVIKLIKSDTYKVVPETRKNEILSFLKDAKDISFSRPKTSLPWGIPVPDDEEHVMYVWCDALSNYITGVGYGNDEKKFKDIWPCDVHVIGKDILRFHAAFWPAMLLSAKVPLPKQLFVHGFVLSKGAKMGKSTGNVIEPFAQLDLFGIDSFRFYLMGSMPIDSDGDYSEEAVIERHNNELVANISNFCYRTLSFTNKNFDSEFKDIDSDKKLEKDIQKLAEEIKQHYESFDFKEAIRVILELSALGNKYMQDAAPWKLIKEDKDKANKVLGTCINIAKIIAIVTNPVMPNFSRKLQHQLNIEKLSWKDINFSLKKHKINSAEIIVNKVEIKQPEKEEKPENIFPLRLRVGKITSVEKHPEADKLYIEQIDYGTEKSQIVSGLAEYYKEDELVGKKVVIVSNLKKAKLRGIESHGMLLAAHKDDEVKVLESDADLGAYIELEGYSNRESQIKIDDFAKVKLKLKDKKVFYKEVELPDVTVDIADGAKIS